MNDDQAQALCDQLMREGYLAARVLPDGTVAGVQSMLTTTALFLGCTPMGYDMRYCFKGRHLAMQRFDNLQSENDVPEGWLARRPETLEDLQAKARPGYLGGDPALPSSWDAAA